MYKYFLFSDKGADAFMESIESVLRQYCATEGATSFMRDKIRMRIEFGREEYYFHFVLFTDAAAAEAVEIAEKHPKHALTAIVRPAPYRVELWGDEDPNMDFFNAHFALMELLSVIPGIAIYDYVRGGFYPEGE